MNLKYKKNKAFTGDNRKMKNVLDEIKESEKFNEEKKRTSKYISKLEQDFYLDLHNKTKNIADREIEYFIDNMDV